MTGVEASRCKFGTAWNDDGSTVESLYREGPNCGLKGDNGVKRMFGEKRTCQSVGRMFEEDRRRGGYCFRGDPRGMRKWKSGEDRPSSCAFSSSKLRGR